MSNSETDLKSIWSHLDTLAFTQGYVDAAGVKTRYVNAGPKDAPVVVMIHGMGGSWENFTANFPVFAQHFNTYAFDLVGHGYSEKPDRVHDVTAYVAQLKGLIEAFGHKKVNLFGLSIGGWTSTRFTVENPDMVDKNIVMSAWGRPRGNVTPEQHEKGMAIRADRLAAVDNPTFEAMDKVFSELIADPKDRMKDLLTLRLRIYLQEGMPEVMRNVFEGVSPEGWTRNELNDEALKSISRPTMVIATPDFPDMFLANALEYKKLIPNLVWKEVFGASHWPQWEVADEVNKIAIEFYNS